MSTSWKSQAAEGDYRIQFETNDYEKFKIVERACCAAIDLEKLKRFVPQEVKEKNETD